MPICLHKEKIYGTKSDFPIVFYGWEKLIVRKQKCLFYQFSKFLSAIQLWPRVFFLTSWPARACSTPFKKYIYIFHTEANGCTFFAAGVCIILIWFRTHIILSKQMDGHIFRNSKCKWASTDRYGFHRFWVSLSKQACYLCR